MVFVRRVPGRSGSIKVQLAERRSGRDVVIEHVGTARDDGELAVLMAQARRRLHVGQEAFDLDGVGLEDEGVPARPGLITSKRSVLLWQVLTDVYARLGFDVIDDEAFTQLVLARIIEATSKIDSVWVLGEVGVDAVSLRTMFWSLQRAQQRDYRGQIAAACFNHAVSDGDVSLVLYDVTTLLCRHRHKRVYVTNIEAGLMPASEVIGSYHDLWHVEQSFRMSKTDLAARPIFHHTRDAIEAHLTIVFAALAVARYLQAATELSIKKIVQTLRPIQQITVRIAGHEHSAADPITPTAETILTALQGSPH